MKKHQIFGLGLGLLSSLTIFSNTAMGQFFSIRHYEGQRFPKATHTYAHCAEQAQNVADKIKAFKYYTLISTGCRTYDNSFQVLVEYGADTGIDFDKFESPPTTLASCETQRRENVARLDVAFPNTVIASFCDPSLTYKNFYHLRIDHMRPRGMYIDRGPFSPLYTTPTLCLAELDKFSARMSSLGAYKTYGDCHPTTQGMEPTVRYAFMYSAFISMDKEFRHFSGSAERDESTCQKENSQFADGLEKVGVPVILSNCTRTHEGYSSVVSVYEPRIRIVDNHASAQRYASREACAQGLETAKLAIEQKTPVVYGFCRILPAISGPSNLWYYTVWFKRPKFPVEINLE